MSNVAEVLSEMNVDMEKVVPGQPADMRACSAGDAVWQGDLGLVVLADNEQDAERAIGELQDYAEVTHVDELHRQLVPGNTQGAKHCLSHTSVRMFHPSGWGVEDTIDSLRGPVFLAMEDVTVEHPTHGHVHVPAGMAVMCVYQREWDAESRRERRNAD